MAQISINRAKTVTTLSLIYLFDVFCCGGAMVIISYVFDSLGLFNMGQTLMFVMWVSYSTAILYTKQILSIFDEMKTSIFVGWIINSLPILIGILAVGCSQANVHSGVCSGSAIYVFNIVAAVFMGGFACTFLWTGQYEFINRVSADEEKKSHFAIFYSLLQFAAIFSNSLNIFFYSFDVNTLWCFSIFYTGFLCVTLSIPWLLPKINGYDPNASYRSEQKLQEMKEVLQSTELQINGKKNEQLNEKPITSNEKDQGEVETTEIKTPGFAEALRRYTNLLMSPAMFKVFPFMIQSGITQTWPQIVNYRFVVGVYKDELVDQAYVKKMICVQAIFVAIGGFTASQALKFITKSTRDKAIIFLSWLIIVNTIVMSAADMYPTTVVMVLIPSFFFGASDVAFNQLVSIYTAEEVPDNTEPFALFKLIQNLFCAVNVLIFMYMQQTWFAMMNAGVFLCLAAWLRYNFSESLTLKNKPS